MRRDKGHFKDPDRSTKEHQDMSMWFTDHENLRNYIRLFLCDIAIDPKATLEVAVSSQSGFLYGYADVLITYRTDQSKNENVLVEVKSFLSDFGETLRQIRTYQEYLRNITKTCLIHAGLDEPIEEQAVKYFGSQGIYIASLSGVIEDIATHRSEKCFHVPAGKRDAELCQIVMRGSEAKFLKNWWEFDFFVKYTDTDLGYGLVDLVSTGNYFSQQGRFWEMVELFSVDIPRDALTHMDPGEISIPCGVDLAYRPGESGYPEAVLERVYVDNRAFELVRPKGSF